MKKKNQELEKFKFVLDYKIKELKKQIEPRENDIKAMKEQIQEVNDLFLLLFCFCLCCCFVSECEEKKTFAFFSDGDSYGVKVVLSSLQDSKALF